MPKLLELEVRALDFVCYWLDLGLTSLMTRRYNTERKRAFAAVPKVENFQPRFDGGQELDEINKDYVDVIPTYYKQDDMDWAEHYAKVEF